MVMMQNLHTCCELLKQDTLPKMPQHRQPQSLLSLCHGQVASDLVSICRLLQIAAQDSSATHILAITRRKLRPRYISQLPGPVRTQLVEEASRLFAAPAPDGSSIGAGPAPLYLLALLLAPDVRSLRVELCCYYGCSHQAALLRLLATEGRGLESLELARPALLRLDRTLLHTALISAPALRHLILKNIAGDGVLQVIGAACPHLESLDVAYSRQVTDAGLRYLFLQVELRDKSPKTSHNAMDCSSGGRNERGDSGCSGWGRLRILMRLLPWIRLHRGEGKKDNLLLEYCERRNPLCDTLRLLNVANTGITTAGILLVLHHVPNLESLGEYGHTGRALEILDRAWTATGDTSISPPNFNLTSAHSCRTTLRRLELLAFTCPRLKKLTVSEPHHLPSALCALSGLTSLYLHSVPPETIWVQDLCCYLEFQGRKLQELTLRFAHKEFTALLDLAQVVQSCPNLHLFISDNASIYWNEKTPRSSIPQLRYLTCVQLGREVSGHAVIELLACAPKLVTAHFHSCPDLNDDHIMQLTQISDTYESKQWSQSPNVHLSRDLECFYVYEAPLLTAPSVAAILSSCAFLNRIGNLSKWGLDCEGLRWIHNLVLGNNLDLELHAGSHWFCSQCIPPV